MTHIWVVELVINGKTVERYVHDTEGAARRCKTECEERLRKQGLKDAKVHSWEM